MPSPRTILAALTKLASDLIQGKNRRAIADLESRVGEAQAKRLAGRGGRETTEVRTSRPKPEEEERQPPPPGEDGDMIEVSGSSNVHSFGYLSDRRELYVRYLAVQEGGARSGPGAMYRYSGVPPAVFERFKAAASKGGAVWDELRIRGTISGARYDYALTATGPDEYVPRKQTGDGLNPREIAQDGRILRSPKPGTGRFFLNP